MTYQPKTLALDANEWKALLLDNIARAHKVVSDSPGINPEGLTMLGGHFDRIKSIAAAWHASQPPGAAAENDAPATAQEAAQANGAAPVKKRGGWPKGKKRNAAAQAVQ